MKHIPRMVYVEGGTFEMGCDNNSCMPNELPLHNVNVKNYYIDISPVSVQDYKKYIDSTHYLTDAQKYHDAGIFNLTTGEWQLMRNRYWQYPYADSTAKAPDNHPVTQISWNDAKAYCACMGKRLPTEAEWEYAARYNTNMLSNKYSWGISATTNSIWKCNVWQGSFPEYNTMEDGFLYTSPVGHYGTLPSGLTDMGGNVWQWCDDAYQLYSGNQINEPHTPNDKVIRGGSFLCDSNVCHGYRVCARNFCSQETALYHLGFRCAMDAE
ncbi:MAG: formylglycine-generating enzyme family protein [Cytophagales bacterium]|nr:formylglycine-generating enzyme family protein [Cytophagales bacterium]